MCVNTYIGTTELVIRNLQMSDSGVYKLIAINNNEYTDKNFSVTLRVEGKQMFCYEIECDYL